MVLAASQGEQHPQLKPDVSTKIFFVELHVVGYKVVHEVLKKGRVLQSSRILVADSKVQRKASNLRQRIIAEVK